MSSISTIQYGSSFGRNFHLAFLKVRVSGLIHCFLADNFTDPYPYIDYSTLLRTSASQAVLQRADRETIILLENKNSVLPLSKTIGSIALIGPQVNRVSVSYRRFYKLEPLKSILIVRRLCLL